MSNKQNLINTIKKGKPLVQSTYTKSGKEYALVKYNNAGFVQFIEVNKNSSVFKQIFEKAPKLGSNTMNLEHEMITDVTSKKLFKNKIIHKIYHIKPTVLNEQSLESLTSLVFKIITKENNYAKITYQGGYRIFVKLHLTETGQGDKFASMTLTENATITQVRKKLQIQANKHYDTIDYILSLTKVELIVTKLSTKGGCNNKRVKIECTKQIDQLTTMRLRSLKSTNNNCLIQCFIYACQLKGNKVKANAVRKAIGLEKGAKIHINDVSKVGDYFKKGYLIMNEKMDILQLKTYGDKNDYIQIMLRDDHYYICEMINRRQCEKCGRVLLMTNNTHKCDIKRISFRRLIAERKQDMVRVKTIHSKNKLNYNKLIFFDLETFQEKQVHVPYACGWSHKSKYYSSYGQQSFNKFVDFICVKKNKIITAYNGSGFDFYFLIDELTSRGVDVKNIILSNGKVMSFTFGDGNKVFDLYLFIMSSLDKACKDFKIENAKSSFDHSKIKTWADTEKHKEEVDPYLKLDVLGLRELFIKFNDMMYDMEQINITQFVTCSHMAYEIWSSQLDDVVEVPSNLKKYNFIKRATFGGRCYPQKREFKSKLYDDVVSGKVKYEELKKSGEFIFNADATSLYPASMAGFELMDVEYPIGRSSWSNNPKEEYQKGTIGFYQVKYKPPKDIRIPVLPHRWMRKNQFMGIRWSLADGEGVFTSVDIKTAIEAGYEIEFTGECLIWEEKGDLFSSYIHKFYKMKEDAERENNNVKRSVAKLLMNALYGKTLQRAIFNTSSIINNFKEFNEFVRDKNLTDFKILNTNKILLTGEVKDSQKETRIRKPSQLGAFVTSYSRRLMMIYFKTVNPDLKQLPFTYTDTDSLHVFGSSYFKLKELGMIKDKKNSSLGFLCSDIKDEGFIIHEKNLAPKTYIYSYITNKNSVKISDDATFKCKGIPKRCLKAEYYHKDQPQQVEFKGLKKKHKNLTKGDVEKGVKHFSIVNNTQTRTFNKSAWGGMTFKNGEWFPHGYNF